MRTLRHLFGSAVAIAALSGLASLTAQAQTPFVLSGGNYLEDFSSIGTWANGFTSPTAATRYGAVAVNATGTVPSPNKITNATATFATGTGGGVQKGTNNIVLLATGAANNTNSSAIDLFLDFTGRNAGTLTFDFASVFNGVGDRGDALRVYGSIDGTTWTELSGGTVTGVTGTGTGTYPILTVNNVAYAGTYSVGLPSIFNAVSTARIRFYVYNGGAVGTTTNRGKISIDNVAVTSTPTAGSPAFTPPGSVSTTNTLKGTPSAGASVGFSGSNLTSTITATTAAPFQVSTDAGATWGTSATIAQNLSTPLLVRLNSATAGIFTGSISYSGGGVGSIPSTTVTGLAQALEPTVQPTVTLSNPTFNTIDVTISGGNGQKYLVTARPGVYGSTLIPNDLTTYTANLQYGGAGASNVGSIITYAVSVGTATTFTITGLNSNTTYYVGAFAFNDDGIAGVENYLTSGFPTTAPSNLNTASATTQVPPPNSYVWVGAPGASYSVGTNWSSLAGSPIGTGQPRTPAPEDILTFGAGTSTVLIDVATPASQTIGGLVLGASSTVTLTLDGATDRTITVAGTVTGADFVVPNGATLNVRNNATGGGLKLTLNSPTTGTIGGTIDMNGASAVLTSDPVLTVSGAASAVEVTSTGSITVGAFVTGGPISGATALIFRNGSTLTMNAGTTPTAAFEPTSTVVWNQNGQLGLSGRTYGNLTLLNHSNATSTGAGALVINNLTFSATGKTLNMSLTGGMTINGNISITAGTLNFTPASGPLTLSSATATVTSVSPITLSGLTLNKPNGATLELDNVITGAAAVTLGTGTNLNIATKLTFSAAAGITAGANTLKLLSTITKTAYVVSTGAGTAVATVQRAVDGTTGINGVGYRHFSTPVSGATVDQLGTGSSPAVFNTAYNTALNPTDGSVLPYPNVFSYDPSRVTTNDVPGFVRGYVSPATGDPMVVGQGYTIRKNRSTVEMTGTLVTGNRNLTLTGNGTLGAFYGWNLVGNPYPSALDWSLTTLPANVGPVAYAIRPTTATGGIYVQYAHTLAAANRELPMAQGIFLRKLDASASTTVVLTNAARVTTGPGNRTFNRAAPLVDPMPTLHLTLGQTGDIVRPEVELYFDATAANGLDNLDGIVPARSFGDAPTLLMLIDGAEAGVNRLAAFTGADVVVPVLVATPLDGQYKIDVSALANFPAGTQVLLEDAVTGRSTDLTQNPSYAFHSDANYAGQRFTLRFTAGRVSGVAADLAASALSVFPNPASGTVRVSAPAGATVRVFDALGRPVRTVRIDAAGTEATLALDGLRAGLYTVRAGAASQKLVIE